MKHLSLFILVAFVLVWFSPSQQAFGANRFASDGSLQKQAQDCQTQAISNSTDHTYAGSRADYESCMDSVCKGASWTDSGYKSCIAEADEYYRDTWWNGLGVQPQDVQKWKDAGFTEDSAASWGGLSLGDIQKWQKVGIQPGLGGDVLNYDYVHEFREMGYSVDAAIQYASEYTDAEKRLLIANGRLSTIQCPSDEVCSPIDFYNARQAAKIYSGDGISISDVLTWTERGSIDAVVAMQLSKAGVDVTQAITLSNYYTDMDVITKLKSKGLTYSDMQAWGNAGDPDIAIDWKNAGYNMAAARKYAMLGLTPQTVKFATSDCKGGIETDVITAVGPYTTKGKCYLMNGVVFQVLGERDALLQDVTNSMIVKVNFGKYSVPAEQTPLSVLLRGSVPYKYMGSMGDPKLVPGATVLYIDCGATQGVRDLAMFATGTAIPCQTK